MRGMIGLALFLVPSLAWAGPTFSKDVAPILFENCTICHRLDAVGPFPLTSYPEAKKRAKQLAQVAQDRTMPPWKPEPGHGEFLDERRLTEQQIQILTEWAATGMPEGNPQDLPKLPKFSTGWQLGQPDLILKMPEPFRIPAEGRDIYQHFVFPLKLSREVFIRGVECRPGNRRVAHHAVGFLDTSGAARKLDAQHAGPGYPGTNQGFIPAGFLGGYAPGQLPRFLEDGVTINVKPGTDFVLQMHYHPTGKEELDQTEIGFYFSKTRGHKSMVIVPLSSEEIDIPAGDADYQARDRFKLPVEMRVVSIWNHQHMIGKSVRVWADLPSGDRRKLLSIQDWDFNWQDTYVYKTPFTLPQGTIVRAQWSWDNSSSNPRNPFSPPRRIRLGEGSTDEMSGLILGGTVKNEADALSHWGAVLGHFIEIKARGLAYQR